MTILAHITEVEKRGQFFVITARDVHKWYHTLFFKEDKWKQIRKEYDCWDIVGLPCILENSRSGRVSEYIQTDTSNIPVFTDNREVEYYL